MRQAQRTRLILVRHGQTDHNREGRLQGQIDIPLNERGLQQAETLARAIASSPPDLLVASPLERARATAGAVARACGLEVTTDRAFLERSFGQWEGLRGEEIHQRWPVEHADWRAHRPILGLDSRDLLEIVEDRYDARSILITSQLPLDRWYEIIGNPTLADAILDRIVHNAYRIELSGESMRKQRG